MARIPLIAAVTALPYPLVAEQFVSDGNQSLILGSIVATQILASVVLVRVVEWHTKRTIQRAAYVGTLDEYAARAAHELDRRGAR